MMESILERENLLRAWQRVKSNAGAPGIDGMTVEGFPAFFDTVNHDRLMGPPRSCFPDSRFVCGKYCISRL